MSYATKAENRIADVAFGWRPIIGKKEISMQCCTVGVDGCHWHCISCKKYVIFLCLVECATVQ